MVLQVGPGVTGLVVGEPVMGLIPHSMAPTAVTDQRLLVPIPPGWSDAQAGGVPIAFATAYYALVELAGLRRGQRVLIHAATGGVGQAALQLARYLGAQVYATASPAKWNTLRSLGVDPDRIASSRTLDFETTFLSATGGQGMDVVLNAVAGELTDASLRLLPCGGHFLEMGKTDIRDPQQITTTHPGVTYQPFDLLRDAGVERLHTILGELSALFASTALSPLPTTSYDIRQAPQALRHMTQARHTGKLALTPPTALDPTGYSGDHRGDREAGWDHRPPPRRNPPRAAPAAGLPPWTTRPQTPPSSRR